jgi:drug/metabolite transporter (DMT)-like permease
MNWILFPLIATFLGASSNFIDKFLISKYFQARQGALVIYSCLIGLPVFILIGLFNESVFNIPFLTALFIILNSFLYIVSLFPYFNALKRADTTVVTPIFQTIPVFTYILALLFLREVLTLNQIMGAVLIIIGSVGVSINIEGGSFHLKKEVLFLMLFASFLISLSWFFFKFFALELDFWKVSFWQYVGCTLFGLILLFCKPSYRTDFIDSLKKTKGKIISLNALNEILNMVAVIVFSYATLLAPLALVSVMNGFQPFFLLLIGVGLSIFFPNLIKEDISKNVFFKKLLLFILILVGLKLINP